MRFDCSSNSLVPKRKGKVSSLATMVTCDRCVGPTREKHLDQALMASNGSNQHVSKAQQPNNMYGKEI